MSNQITTAMVNQYSANVFHLSQQKGSRLRGLVRTETQKAESAFYERIGLVSAQKKSGRHADIEYSETPHSRRMVTLEDYFWADLVDKEDKLRLIISPESHYVQAASNAMGRSMDDILIAAALGSAYSGKTGGTSVALPDSQKVGCIDAAGTGFDRLNVKTLRRIKKKFMQNEAGDSQLYIVVDSEQIDSMLSEDVVQSSDYNAVKALVQGDVDTFMGFKFIRSERLPQLAAAVTTLSADGSITGGAITAPIGTRRCVAFQKEGVLLAMSQNVMSKVEPLPTKHYANQVYASMGLGATRLEEEKVVEIYCKENA